MPVPHAINSRFRRSALMQRLISTALVVGGFGSLAFAQIIPAPPAECWVSDGIKWCCDGRIKERTCGGPCSDTELENAQYFASTLASSGLQSLQELGEEECRWQPKKCGGWFNERCVNDGDPSTATCKSTTPTGDSCGPDPDNPV